MAVLKKKRIDDKKARGILLLFALLYSLGSIVNHLMMRTYALDLGVYTHALWQYAHGQWADCSILRGY